MGNYIIIKKEDFEEEFDFKHQLQNIFEKHQNLNKYQFKDELGNDQSFDEVFEETNSSFTIKIAGGYPRRIFYTNDFLADLLMFISE